MIMPVPQSNADTSRTASPEPVPNVWDAALRSIKANVVGNPAVSLAAAIAVGVAVGCLVKRR